MTDRDMPTKEHAAAGPEARRSHDKKSDPQKERAYRRGRIISGTLVIASAAVLVLVLSLGDCSRDDDSSPERPVAPAVDPAKDILPLITDPGFKKYCLMQMGTGLAGGWDKDNDGKLAALEASIVTWIVVPRMEIAELTGLEWFTGLEHLDCSGNRLIRLDLSRLNNLVDVKCDNNQITDIDLSDGYMVIKSLRCGNNLLTALDISRYVGLDELECSDNPGSEGKFVVTAWFDGATMNPNMPYTMGSWNYDGKKITIEYVDVD